MRGRHALVLSTIVLAHAGAVHAQSTGAGLAAAEIHAACAPAQVMTAPAPTLHVVGSQDTTPRVLFGPRELVIVNGGTQAGVQIGQDYYIRREYAFGRQPSKIAPRTITTVGWLKIVSLNETTAIGQIDTTCEGVLAGDYLELFTAPVAVAAEPGAAPFSTLDFSTLARVMFGKEERRLGSTGDFMMLSGNPTFEIGRRVAVYRDLHTSGVPLTAIGEGVIVSVSNGTPLMRITATRDAVQSGDYVVPHR